MGEVPVGSPVRSERIGNVAVVYAGDYLNKLSGERIERVCRERLREGCRALVVDFKETSMVNSIGVSILLGVIDAAERASARLVFADASGQTAQLFQLLGLTRHVTLTPDQQTALNLLTEFTNAGASNH